MDGWRVKMSRTREERRQHRDRVRRVLQERQRLEQASERRILPAEEAGRLSQGPHTLPAFGTFGTGRSPLLCLKLGKLSILGGQFVFEPLGT
jgi:hypothetical protein